MEENVMRIEFVVDNIVEHNEEFDCDDITA